MRAFRALFVVLVSLFVAAPLRADPFSAVYVFGDSLSDAGNAYAGSGGTYPPDPPYYQGRFSNGPVWAEQFAASLGLAADSIYVGGSNYAFGGGLTAGASPYGTPSLQDQVGLYTQGGAVQADPKALYVVWSGANDPILGGQTDPTVSAQNVVDAVAALAAAGAREFLVVNMPDLGKTPLLQGDANASAFSAGFNQALKAGINQLAADENLTIHQFDVARLFDDMLANPSKYGYTNTTSDALTDGVYSGDGYLFWDTVHPTSYAHGVIATAAARVANSPEPTSLLLLATGGALFWLRRRGERGA